MPASTKATLGSRQPGKVLPTGPSEDSEEEHRSHRRGVLSGDRRRSPAGRKSLPHPTPATVATPGKPGLAERLEARMQRQSPSAEAH